MDDLPDFDQEMTDYVAPERKTVVLDAEQEQAVNDSCDLKNRVVAVTGDAGTGKTTVLEKIYNNLVEAGYNVALCSPTGKAAKRITEVTGIPAFTIHRLLEYTHPGDPDPRTGKPAGVSMPRRNRATPLDYDVILGDEYMMVPQDLHDALLAALGYKACIRVFGDMNQLDPIENDFDKDKPKPPAPFETLIKKFKATRLTKVYRQAEDSGILMNLQSILNGKMPTKNRQWDMSFTDAPTETLVRMLKDMLNEGHDFSKIDNQIITTQNKGWVGTQNLNILVQGMFHSLDELNHLIPRNKWVEGIGKEKGGQVRMFVGDKVICTRNSPELGIMNGESGVIQEISNDGELVIDFGDKVSIIPPLMTVMSRYGKFMEIDPRKDIDLGYAITTHKSQGSEYKRVVYMLNKSTLFMQSRRNFYTAASRAREHVQLVTDQISLRTSLNKKDTLR